MFKLDKGVQQNTLAIQRGQTGLAYGKKNPNVGYSYQTLEYN